MNESMSGILKDNFTVYRSGQLFATISMIDNDLVVDTPYGKIPGERLPPQDPSDRFLGRWWFSNEIKGRAVYHMSTIRKTVKNQYIIIQLLLDDVRMSFALPGELKNESISFSMENSFTGKIFFPGQIIFFKYIWREGQAVKMKGEAISAPESGADFFSGKWVNEQEPNDVISIIKRDNEAYFVYGRRLVLQQYHYSLFGKAIKVDVNNKTLEGRVIDEFQLVISREENRLVLVLPSLNKIEYMTGYYVWQQ